MILLIQVALFLAAFFSNKKYISLVLAIAAFLIPDEVPMVDEILMVAATARTFYQDAKERGRREEIPEGKAEEDVRS